MASAAPKRLTRVLLVDHDTALVDRLAAIVSADPALGGGGEQLVIASQSGDVMRLFREKHPDLVLIAVRGDGREARSLCHLIRAEERDTHTGVVLLSQVGGSDEDQLATECLEAGADDFVLAGAGDVELKGRLKTVLRMKAMTDELRSANHKLTMISKTDELTGLSNMRGFNARFSERLSACKEGMLGFGVIMMDMDRFKTVNDGSHHLMGSHVLATVGRLIAESGVLDPAHDTAARYGGDEFIVLIGADDLGHVESKARSIKRLIDENEYVYEEHRKRVTVSVGVAFVARGYSGRAEDVIKAADLMLYRSKEQGRNTLNAMVYNIGMDVEHQAQSRMVAEHDFEEEQ
jgi:diguanylate cyclase (GGDEF)-like protein